MVNEDLLRNEEFFNPLSASIKLLILFVVGVGNYRVVLLLIIFLCLKAFIDHKNEHTILQMVFLPLMAIAVFFDYTYGQLWLPHNYNLILFVIGFVIVDHVAARYINEIIERASKGYVFSCCDKCRYENNKLTTRCVNCGNTRLNIQSKVRINTNKIYNENFLSPAKLFLSKLTYNSVLNLSLEEGELISIVLKVGFGNSPYIDNNKTLCNHIVVTNKNIILMHKLKFQRGWRWRDKIKLNEISEISSTNKNVSISTRQAIKISSINHTYEIFLWAINRSQDQFDKHFNIIKQHVQDLQSVQR